MKIKVCGLRDISNINALNEVEIHFVGLNFYHKSKRQIDHTLACTLSNYRRYPKVGVFVNARERYLLDMVKIYGLEYVQLHGDESPEYVETIKKEVKVIKVFSIQEKKDFAKIEAYHDCYYFLFDTKTPEYGGSGMKFDWALLENYSGKTKFFLAGGIGPDDIIAIKKINHPAFHGVDINSAFEIEPGLKDIDRIITFLNNL